MTWTTEAQLTVPLSMVISGQVGQRRIPVLLTVWERSKNEGKLDCLYVAQTVHGAHSRLTWHVNRQTALGKYLVQGQNSWSYAFLVDLEHVSWRIDEAELVYKSTLKPKFHRGDREEKIAGAIMRDSEQAWHEGFMTGRWRDGNSRYRRFLG